MSSCVMAYIMHVMSGGVTTTPNFLTLKSTIATKVVCFLVCLNVEEASMADIVEPDQTAPIGAVYSWSSLFASILKSSVTLGNYLQQTASADDIFRCIFWWCFKG